MLKIEKDENGLTKIVDVTCNMCAMTCAKRFGPSSSDADHGGFYGLIEAKVYGGYLSNDLEDCTAYMFSLCETCLKKMFSDFKIQVQKFEDRSFL